MFRKTILAGISDKDGATAVRVLLNLEAASNAYSGKAELDPSVTPTGGGDR